MTTKIGFYICHCGINIAHRVDVQAVAGFAKRLPDVVVARDYKFMCSDPGQAMIEKDIAELGLNRVVVASCSPRLHGKTFMGACERAGLNPYLFQMASVREQVSWVTLDAAMATEKAKTLVAGAVNRVHYHESLDTQKAPVNPDMLVVGGGIAGMQAALDIAAAGNKVYLVEKNTTIGGHMLQFDKTFPTLDCAACIGTPKMVEVAQNANIELHTCSEVAELSGFVGNFTVTIKKRPRYVKEGLCTGCGECAKVCPVSITNDWDEHIGTRQAIGRAFPQAIPITFNIEKKDRAPCTTTCPAGINVQGYIQLIRQKKYQEAVQLIMERLPLPRSVGRVCPHPCEAMCRRQEVDAPVAICRLKRFAADQVNLQSLPLPPIQERREKIAIVGSGPAGLTAAYFLRLKGYQITVYEAMQRLGGMLRFGIPDYRLPSEILDNEIENILRLGIVVKKEQQLGRDFTLQDLHEKGFDAVFMGIGAQGALDLNIPCEKETTGVIDAAHFLREVNLGNRVMPGNKVAVVGGGNVAVDAARSALRLGVTEVTLIYRRSAEEMPAYTEELQGAHEEGIAFVYLAVPIRIETITGKVSGLTCLRNELGPPDASGRRRPIPIQGSDFFVACDAVIIAVGQKAETSWADKVPELEWTSRGTLKVDPVTGQTPLPYLFAAGDMVSGPATVVEAIGAAHKAVEAIDCFLQKGSSENHPKFVPPLPGHDWAAIPDSIIPEQRVSAFHIANVDRIHSFDEIEKTITEEAACREATRCLNCGICCECMACVSACEAQAIDHDMQPERLEVKVGSIILATGYDILDPTPMEPYGYGRLPNVFTALEFERLSNATGPTGGKILMRNSCGAFTRPPQSVALLHCIGSRDVHFHEYCSRVCCMYALKYTHLIKEKVGYDTAVYDFYIDMRCFGEGYEEFYRRCQEEGTLFIRGKVAEISDQALTAVEQDKLIAVAEDTLLGQRIRVPVDMVILCTAMEARKDAHTLGRVFGVNRGADGFFLEEHPKLGPLNTATDGVFLAGCCQKPMDIPDTVSQASGAAAKALALAARGWVEVPPTISWIDPAICTGCQICIDLCPYGAIGFNQRLGISEVNPAMCKGCGSCSGFCPSNAAGSKHFNSKQVFAEIDGIFDADDRLKAGVRHP